MKVHSEILVHWTGKKDIEKAPDANRPSLYVDRLRDDLQNGLFTKRIAEDSIRHWKIKRFVRVCFTEIRLNEAQVHAGRYGSLGIGFTRDFIMGKGGRPVIYLPFDPTPDGSLLDDSISKAWTASEGNDEVHGAMKWLLAHVKRMSNGLDERSAEYEDYFEEMEWRLAYDESLPNKHFRRESDGVFRLPFAAEDVKVIVFPDDRTRRLALEDPVISTHFSVYMPDMPTLEECLRR